MRTLICNLNQEKGKAFINKADESMIWLKNSLFNVSIDRLSCGLKNYKQLLRQDATMTMSTDFDAESQSSSQPVIVTTNILFARYIAEYLSFTTSMVH